MPGSGMGRPQLDLEPYREDITELWNAGLTLPDIVDTLNQDEQVDLSMSLSTLQRTLKE